MRETPEEHKARIDGMIAGMGLVANIYAARLALYPDAFKALDWVSSLECGGDLDGEYNRALQKASELERGGFSLTVYDVAILAYNHACLHRLFLSDWLRGHWTCRPLPQIDGGDNA